MDRATMTSFAQGKSDIYHGESGADQKYRSLGRKIFCCFGSPWITEVMRFCSTKIDRVSGWKRVPYREYNRIRFYNIAVGEFEKPESILPRDVNDLCVQVIDFVRILA